jgi:hypothetical protein
MADVEPYEKNDWLQHPCTIGLMYLLEHARVQSWELAEEGPEPHKMNQLVYQAQLARNLTEDLMAYIMDVPETETND